MEIISIGCVITGNWCFLLVYILVLIGWKCIINDIRVRRYYLKKAIKNLDIRGVGLCAMCQLYCVSVK